MEINSWIDNMKREIHLRSPDQLFGSSPKKEEKIKRSHIQVNVQNTDKSGNNTLEASKIRRHQREEKCCIANSYEYVQFFYNKYQKKSGSLDLKWLKSSKKVLGLIENLHWKKRPSCENCEWQKKTLEQELWDSSWKEVERDLRDGM